MIYHTIALAAGFILDLIFGDPRWLYHPVCLIGNLISFLEKRIRKILPKTSSGELTGGLIEVLIVCILSLGIPAVILYTLYPRLPWLALLLESFWCYQLLATRSLKDESMRVYDRLKYGTLEEARKAVSMIVGRDTAALTEEGVTKAAVETVAENASDGVIAPMLYMAIGGAPLMFLYKGINTMDSMLGYKNDKYMYFGRFAAKSDDVVNFIPARLASWIMIAATGVVQIFSKDKKYNMKDALRIYRRDKHNHSSPNSAHTESVCAGALGVRLAGDNYYFGKLVKKPYIGDDSRPVEIEDIKRVNILLYVTTFLCIIMAVAVRIIIFLGRMCV